MEGPPGTLSIEIKSGKNLPSRDFIIPQDPYVYITKCHEGEEPNDGTVWKKTETITRGGTEPIWTDPETFIFSCVKSDIIYIVACDEDIGTDDIIGYTKIHVNELVQEDGVKKESDYELQFHPDSDNDTVNTYQPTVVQKIKDLWRIYNA